MTPDFLIFDGELVIICDFLPDPNWLLGVDHYLILPVNLDHFGIAVGLRRRKDKTFSFHKKLNIDVSHLTAVVDEPSQIATLCGINHILKVNTEQVGGSNALLEGVKNYLIQVNTNCYLFLICFLPDV